MTKNNLLQKNISYSVTRDSGANVKILKKLENTGLITIYDVLLENGRENKKVKNKVLPVGVWGHSKWGEAVYSGDDCKYSEIREIIGRENIEDAMHLEAHIRNNHDYFITEDNDFLSKREDLNKKFNVKIMTPTELEKTICKN